MSKVTYLPKQANDDPNSGEAYFEDFRKPLTFKLKAEPLYVTKKISKKEMKQKKKDAKCVEIDENPKFDREKTCFEVVQTETSKPDLSKKFSRVKVSLDNINNNRKFPGDISNQTMSSKKKIVIPVIEKKDKVVRIEQKKEEEEEEDSEEEENSEQEYDELDPKPEPTPKRAMYCEDTNVRQPRPWETARRNIDEYEMQQNFNRNMQVRHFELLQNVTNDRSTLRKVFISYFKSCLNNDESTKKSSDQSVEETDQSNEQSNDDEATVNIDSNRFQDIVNFCNPEMLEFMAKLFECETPQPIIQRGGPSTPDENIWRH